MRFGHGPDTFEIDAQHAHGTHPIFTLHLFRFARQVLNVDGFGEALCNVAVSSTADFSDVDSAGDGGASGHQLDLSVPVFHGFHDRTDVGVQGFFPDKNHSAFRHVSRFMMRLFIP